jgi:hypothetical protein
MKHTRNIAMGLSAIGALCMSFARAAAQSGSIIPAIKFDRGPGTTPSGGNGFDAGTSIPSSGSASIPIPAGSFFMSTACRRIGNSASVSARALVRD